MQFDTIAIHDGTNGYYGNFTTFVISSWREREENKHETDGDEAFAVVVLLYMACFDVATFCLLFSFVALVSPADCWLSLHETVIVSYVL